jgi:hypothetical protein
MLDTVEARRNKHSLIRSFVERWPSSVRETTEDGVTLLHLVARFDELELIRFLVGMRPESVQQRMRNGWKRSLFVARPEQRRCRSSDSSLSSGPSPFVHATSNYGYTPAPRRGAAGIPATRKREGVAHVPPPGRGARCPALRGVLLTSSRQGPSARVGERTARSHRMPHD